MELNTIKKTLSLPELILTGDPFYPIIKHNRSAACYDVTSCKPMLSWINGEPFDDFGYSLSLIHI